MRGERLPSEAAASAGRLLGASEAAELLPVEAVAAMPVEALPGMVLHLAALQAVAAARLANISEPARSMAGDGTECVTVEEAAKRLGMNPHYLYKHKHEFGFVVQIAPGQLRCSVRGIERYIAARTIRSR